MKYSIVRHQSCSHLRNNAESLSTKIVIDTLCHSRPLISLKALVDSCDALQLIYVDNNIAFHIKLRDDASVIEQPGDRQTWQSDS